MSALPRLIAFEGVDGAGKSSVIVGVAEQLRARGHAVFMPREGKQHAARIPRAIRRITRDARNLTMSPRAELTLYCAREAQVLAELVRPALARGDIVLLDRSLLTPVVLGAYGRGLELAQCQAAADVAAGGLEPELTLIFDVDPRTSRMRKRIEKARTLGFRDRGRKGLAGSGLKQRVRDGYLAIAAARGMPVFHAERTSPQALVQRVLAALDGAAPEPADRDARPWWRADPALPFADALAQLPIPVALYLSRGLRAGRPWRARAIEDDPRLVAWALDPEDPSLERATELAPELALARLAGLPLRPRDPRVRAADTAPAAALRGLVGVDGPEADAVRRSLRERAPGAVVESLRGREDAFATALRAELWTHADACERASSLATCTGPEAASLREELFESHAFLALESLVGVEPARADPWLERHAEHAPRCVLAALVGRSDAFAHSMRERLRETGPESVDGLIGLDDETSWAMRERWCERWPSAVLHSVFGVPDSPRRRAMIERCRGLADGDLHVLRRACELEELAS